MIIAVIYIVGMLPVSVLIKLVIHRPRYRWVVRVDCLNSTIGGNRLPTTKIF